MSTALYRRYRPDTFEEVIGQEHVVEPLMRALDNNRVNHAYLFSGPRGCGKTTSARILARCMNCAEGPTGTPCGRCESCVDLATGGPGSLDVVEIDAASHNGVDDARDLRERAIYAPARDRYKIFILDEAHMVTTQGFNALLKLVEEPPEHVKFVFATTEPDKVIGTIRSRTHHYPFRLVPPERLRSYLAELCEREGVEVAKGVLPLVVRAGGGSVRDTLSVLDQLMAGAGPEGMSYERAIALLGYTHATLLDDVVEGFGAADGAAVFRVVDRVIESGHDPRRFVEDLLERLRDLIIIHAAPESAQAILPGIPADQLERMSLQAQSLGAAELSRAADVLNAGLSEMSGATSPRLQLELICARVLLPGIESSSQAMQSRIDRLERRVGSGAMPRTTTPAPAEGSPSEQAPRHGVAERSGAGATQPPSTALPALATPSPSTTRSASATPERDSGVESTPPEVQRPASAEGAPQRSAPRQTEAHPEAAHPVAAQSGPAQRQSATATPAQHESGESEPADHVQSPQIAQPQQRATPQQQAAPTSQTPRQGTPGESQSGHESAPPERASAAPAAERSSAGTAPTGGGPGTSAAVPASGDLEAIRRSWPQIVDTLSKGSKLTWALVSQNATVLAFGEGALTLGFPTEPLANRFNGGQNPSRVAAALAEELGIEATVKAVVGKDPSGPAPGGGQPGDGGGPRGKGPGGSRGSDRRDAGLQAPPEERSVDPWQPAEPAQAADGDPWYTPEEDWARDTDPRSDAPGTQAEAPGPRSEAPGPQAEAAGPQAEAPDAVASGATRAPEASDDAPERSEAAAPDQVSAAPSGPDQAPVHTGLSGPDQATLHAVPSDREGQAEDVADHAANAPEPRPEAGDSTASSGEPEAVSDWLNTPAPSVPAPGEVEDVPAEENFIGAYADLDISFTSNPGYTPDARAVGSSSAQRTRPGPRSSDVAAAHSASSRSVSLGDAPRSESAPGSQPAPSESAPVEFPSDEQWAASDDAWSSADEATGSEAASSPKGGPADTTVVYADASATPDWTALARVAQGAGAIARSSQDSGGPARGAGTGAGGGGYPQDQAFDPHEDELSQISEDDEDQAGSTLVGRAVVESILGGVVIEEKNE